MHRFKKVGVVFDLEHSNSNVLAHAKELIELNEASIHLLCVIPRHLQPNQQKHIEASLRETIGFDFTLHYLIGKPVTEMTRYSVEHSLDLILIEPTENKKQFNRFFQGSLTLSLTRQIPCPVWIIKKPLATTYQRIMIAVNPRYEEDEQHEQIEAVLNEKLIQIGTSYAKRQSAECYLVTAWRLEGESMLESPFIRTPPEELERLKNEEKIKCVHAFEQLQQQHRDILHGCQTRILHGDPGGAITEFVMENNIDLVIMGTLARAGIQGFLMGNTAESIINQVDCSIMAIKPEGFVSPIMT